MFLYITIYNIYIYNKNNNKIHFKNLFMIKRKGNLPFMHSWHGDAHCEIACHYQHSIGVHPITISVIVVGCNINFNRRKLLLSVCCIDFSLRSCKPLYICILYRYMGEVGIKRYDMRYLNLDDMENVNFV